PATPLTIIVFSLHSSRCRSQLHSFPTRRSSDLQAELIEPLGDVVYQYQRKGRRIAKQVRFFLFRYVSGSTDDHVAEQEEPHLLRSEEHTSELQSPDHLVCRLLLEKKKLHNTIVN